MLGILIPYHSFFEILNFQINNIRHFVKVEHRILIIDDSDNEVYSLQTMCEELNVEFWKISPHQHKLFGNHPSARHQHALNTGIEMLNDSCRHILIFDNDMVFTEPFAPLLKNEIWYVPQKRGEVNYPWLNLFFFPAKEFTSFDFATCPVTGETTDPGGNLAGHLQDQAAERCHLIKQEWSSTTYFLEYQQKYRELCEHYCITPWFDIFHFLGTSIFHFRGLSNWQGHPEEFLAAKKRLILEELTLFQNTYLH